MNPAAPDPNHSGGSSASDDDDKTFVRPAAAGPGSTFSMALAMSAHTLPEGTRLRDHQITGLIGEGGFGIVYLAYDHSLQRRVAIKEYMPSAMASRANASSSVVVKSERHLDTFRLGLKSFVNEARLLARFDHPSLVKVYRFWEENGTAYMVMPYYEGPTLKRALAELGRPPDEAELRAWLRPLLDALTVMHASQCYHRDIAPDNILLTAAGPLLLDFGAARRVISDMTHALTVMLKPGFAPIEQYGEVSTMAQGAWTDLYALASVVYAAVTGHAPMSSVERLMDDRLELLSVLAAGRYSEPFLMAIDSALALRPNDRPQDVAAFRRLMEGRMTPAGPPPAFASTYSAPLELVLPEPTSPPVVATPAVAQAPVLAISPTPAAAPAFEAPTPASTAVPVPAAVTAWPPLTSPPLPAPSPATSAMPPPPAAALPGAASPRHRKAAAYAIAALIGVAVLGAVGYFSGRARPPVAASEPVPVPSMTAPAVPAPAPAATPAAEPMPSPAVAAPAMPAAPPVAAPAEPSPVVPEPAPPPTIKPAVPPVAKAAPAPIVKPAAPPEPRPRPPPSEAAPRTDTERPAPTANPSVTGSRCSDILQKASLEPLTASEAVYLKRECR